jgi:hypothetical protein
MTDTAPHAIIPTPAAQFRALRGRRVIVGIPGFGFRNDMRADNAVVQNGRTFVPVLTEQDYYRAEQEQLEVFAPLVPIDRVWVEEPQPMRAATILPALDGPQARIPRPAADAERILGCRLIQRVPDGFVRDLRAVSDIYLAGLGVPTVRVCGEAEWYAWAITGIAPSTTEVAATDVWVD